MEIQGSDATAQNKITQTIDAYKTIYLEEYSNFLKGQSQRIKLSGKHGLWKDTKAMGEWRHLAEIPVTLYNLLKSVLNPVEWKYYNSEQGKLWLVKKYPEFLAREKV